MHLRLSRRTQLPRELRNMTDPFRSDALGKTVSEKNPIPNRHRSLFVHKKHKSTNLKTGRTCFEILCFVWLKRCLKTRREPLNIKLFSQCFLRFVDAVSTIPMSPRFHKCPERREIDRRQSRREVISLSHTKDSRLPRRVKEHTLARRQVFGKLRRQRVERDARRLPG